MDEKGRGGLSEAQIRELRNYQYIFHEDPGHGWLQVPLSHIALLKIENEITPFSYMDNEFVYLEEDCDFKTFIEVFRASIGIERENMIIEIIYPDRDAPIRKKQHYSPHILANRIGRNSMPIFRHRNLRNRRRQ